MGNRKYSINFDEMDYLASGLNKIIIAGDTVTESMDSDFKNLNQSGLFGNKITGISKAVSGVNSIIQSSQNKIIKQSNAMKELEFARADKLEETQVPQDFVKSDTRKYNSIEDIQLSKKDDKSVNEGEQSEEFNEIADNSIKDEENLFDLTKKDTEMVNEIADNSIKDEEKLYDLTGEKAKEFEEIADNSIEDEEKLKDMTGEESKEFEEIADNSIEDEEKLKNITGEESTQVQDKTLDSLSNKTATNLSSQSGDQSGMTASYSTNSSAQYSQPQGNAGSVENNEPTYTPSSNENEKEEKKEEKDNTLNEMMNNLSTYQNMERMNEEAQKNLSQQESENQ